MDEPAGGMPKNKAGIGRNCALDFRQFPAVRRASNVG
jgi:hypothetical protein